MVITAKQANILARATGGQVDNEILPFLEKVFEEIYKSALRGNYCCSVWLYIESSILASISQILKKLEYKVEIFKDRLLINW